MTRFASRVLPEMEAILRYNGIDINRVTDATIHHSVEGVVTEITVKMYALKPEDES
jgi:hypothetical protein